LNFLIQEAVYGLNVPIKVQTYYFYDNIDDYLSGGASNKDISNGDILTSGQITFNGTTYSQVYFSTVYNSSYQYNYTTENTTNIYYDQ
jgi:hypothetical protein